MTHQEPKSEIPESQYGTDVKGHPVEPPSPSFKLVHYHGSKLRLQSHVRAFISHSSKQPCDSGQVQLF